MRRVRTARMPTPGGPPHLWADAASADQPSGSGSRPADAHASTKRGTPSSRAATSATGCSVPTSWLADWQATTVASPSGRGRRGRSGPRRRPGPTGWGSASRRPPAGPPSAPRPCARWCRRWRSAPRWRPRRPRCTASVPEAVKVTSSGRSPSASAVAARALSRTSRAARPVVVEPPRVGVRRVEGGREGLAGGRVQRLARTRCRGRPGDRAPRGPRRMTRSQPNRPACRVTHPATRLRFRIVCAVL